MSGDKDMAQAMNGSQLLDAVRLGQLPAPPIFELMGITLAEFGEGWAVLDLEVNGRLYNSMGYAHGGVIATLGDAVMGTALITTLRAGELFTTLELHTNYMRAAKSTRLSARGQVVRRGRTTAYCEAEISDADGRLMAKASCTCMVQQGQWLAD